MTIFALKGSLEEITPAQLSEQTCSAVFITDSAHAEETLRTANITYEGVISLRDVVFCKIESQPFCLAGTLSIPKLLDIKGSRHRIQFFIDNKNMVIIDDEEFSLRLVQRIQRSRHNQGESREHFIYNFFSEFMLRDTELLAEHEQKLMELEEDENGFFEKKQKKYFGTISDRADRLMGRTVHLLEYATQVRDAYQSHVNAQQNKNMEFLTVISTIFFPLTLITGWYGMNFQNMPELKEGYPGVIALSIIVVIVCIIFFKRKKML
jgi:magnesium transporter